MSQGLLLNLGLSAQQQCPGDRVYHHVVGAMLSLSPLFLFCGHTLSSAVLIQLIMRLSCKPDNQNDPGSKCLVPEYTLKIHRVGMTAQFCAHRAKHLLLPELSLETV